MRTAPAGVRSARAVLATTLGLAAAVTVAVPAAGTTGNVGPYRFATARSAGSSASCSFGSSGLTRITVAAPRAAMRSYWTKPHGGRQATAQNVDFAVRLTGLRSGRWVNLSTLHRSSLVRAALSTVADVSAFTRSSGLKSGYDAYRVDETLSWLRPTDNAEEGSASTTVGNYLDGRTWRGSCVRAHPAISTASLPTAYIGRAYSATLRASGVGPFTWSQGSDPGTGRVLSKAGVVNLSTVRTTGNRTVTAHVRDGNGLTATRVLTIRAGYLAGDVNGDGTVDCADIDVIDNHWGLTAATRALGDLTGDGVVNDADASAFAAAHRGTPCPLMNAMVTATPNDNAVDWSVSVIPRGALAHVHATNNHGGVWDWDTGVGRWTSPTVTDTVGYSTDDTITVTVSGTGRSSLVVTGSATTAPPAPPSITAFDGGRGAKQPGTCNGGCHTLNFTVSNFPLGRYTWRCINSDGVYYDSADQGYLVTVSSPSQTFGGSNLSYCENTNGQTAIQIIGVQSNYVYLGSG